MAKFDLYEVSGEYAHVFLHVGKHEAGRFEKLEERFAKAGKKNPALKTGFDNFNKLWGRLQAGFIAPLTTFLNLMLNGGVEKGDNDKVDKIAALLHDIFTDFEKVYAGILKPMDDAELAKLSELIEKFALNDEVLRVVQLMAGLTTKYPEKSKKEVWT